MNVGWKTKRLGDVCEIIKGRKPILKPTPSNGDLPYLVAKVMRGNQEAEYASPNDRNSVTVSQSETIIICDGSNSGEIFTGFSGILSSTMGKISKKAEIDDNYLRAFLASTFEVFNGAKTGAAIPHLDKEALYALEFPLPPLPEQQCIVGILDDAFEGIATAKANAEKSLQNARALMRASLQSVLSAQRPDWLNTTIGEQIMLQRGFDITKSQQKPGRVPVVSSGGIKSFHDTAMVQAPGIVIGRKGTLGKVFYLEEDFWPHDTTLWVKKFNGNDSRFVYYFLTGLDVIHLDSGAANPALNRNQVHPIKVNWPPISQQKIIAAKLDALSEEAKRLESIYQRKLAALDELKKSLLHQAFTGELTKQSRRAVVIPFPTKIPGITTTDLHAGILATAFQLHEKNGKQKYFGHVKAEKIAHMVEAHLGIELGRTPVKDAAGPNDFRHLKGVEHRAKMAKFFDFQRVEGRGYRVTKHRQFEELIERTRDHLGERSRDLDSLLALMLPMNTEEAEVFVTVYAAWNNLLLDKQPITDESIVFEARENWHPNKLNIERRKFFKAIEWMKEHDVVPQGGGKKVNSKVEKKK